MPPADDSIPLNIESVVAPQVQPSSVPDEKTTEEFRQAERISKLTPTARHLHALERLLAERQSECERLRVRTSDLQLAVDDLRPKYATLIESHKNAVDNGAIASVSNLIGSSSLAIAGFFDIAHEAIKWMLVGGGVVFVAVAVWMCFRSWYYTAAFPKNKS